MGTIVSRKRKDGTTAHMARIILKRDGGVIHNEAKTFDRKAAAQGWIANRELELSKPGAIERANKPSNTLSDAIDKYVADSIKKIGRTKAQVLNSIKSYPIADMKCEAIGSADILEFAKDISANRTPSTVGNYLSHLSAVFAIAKPAWNYDLDRQALADAFTVAKRLGITGKSRQRERRPTLAELDQIFTHLADRRVQRPDAIPMDRLIAFAIFSTRRLEEICRIEWKDLNEETYMVMVRDMKNPGEKIGNNVWCDIPEQALKIIQAMPKTDDRIFPYNHRSLSSNFTRLTSLLGIEDLHFHDLRHEGVSRLFEMGKTIPHVAAVSGHRSWQSLKRYSHVRQSNDRFEGWSWLDSVTTPLLP